MTAPRIPRHQIAIAMLAVVAAFGAVSTWILVSGNEEGAEAIREALGRNPSVVSANQYGDISLAQGMTAAVKRALPSVVNISSTKVIEQPQGPLPMPFFERFFGPMPEERKAHSLGSGVIVGDEGCILTNDHVIRQATEIEVRLGDELEELEAEIVGRDPKTDLALIKLKAGRHLPVLSFADSSSVEVGDFALAIGNPFGLQQTVTFGIISATGRGGLGIEELEDFIQTDASINPGNSGGALINTNGELIGINTAIVARGGGNQGIGFAVPSNMARNVMDQLLEHGRVIRGWMGVNIQPVTPSLARGLGLDEPRGALVSSVADGSPADQAGIQRGDVIVELNGKTVKDARNLQLAVARSSPGDEAKIEVVRNDLTKNITVKLGEMPTEPTEGGGPAMKDSDKLGLSVQPLDDQLVRRLGVAKGTTGVVVTGVVPGSPAAQAGLRRGDVIEEINRQDVTDVQDFVSEVRNAGEVVLLLVNRGGNTIFVPVERG